MPEPTLYDARAQAVSEARQILDRADREKRDLTADEQTHYDRVDQSIDALNERIAKQEQAAASKRRQVPPSPPAGSDGAALTIDYPGFDLGSPGVFGERFLSGRRPRQTVLHPGTDEHRRSTKQYHEAWLKYLATGREQLGLLVGKDHKGGYLAPTAFSTDLIKFLDNNVFMRQLCTVLPPLGQAVSIGIPLWEADPGDADWSAEVPASDISEDDTASLGKRELMPHLCTKLVKISNKLMRSSVIDPDSLLRDRLGYKFQVTEEQAFQTGDGAQQPLGVFIASADGVPTTRNVTASSTTAFTGDDVINLLYNLKEQYQRNATGLFSREFVKRLRKLKTGDGQYLWEPGLSGQPNTVLSRPYVMSEYVPSTYTTGLYIGMFADFKAGYWIADSLQMETQVLGELFALKNQTGVICRKETDGAPVLAEAFSRLILA